MIEFTLIGEGSPAIQKVRAPLLRHERGIDIAFNGRVFSAVPAAVARSVKKRPTGALTAPMMGIVAEVMVIQGQHVEAHDPLMVIEAMKVMATVEAPFAGTVTAVHFVKGDVAPHGEVVVDLSPDAPEMSPR